MPPFTYPSIVRLHLTDAAGILFFANYFVLAHEAYEAFVTSRGFSFRQILDSEPFMVPIVHAEGDYQAPLRVSDVITITVRLEKLGDTSYTLGYTIADSTGKSVAELKTVHVLVSKSAFEKIPLTPGMRTALESLK